MDEENDLMRKRTRRFSDKNKYNAIDHERPKMLVMCVFLVT